MLADVSTAAQLDAGYVYITDLSGGNPYDALPSYWDQEVSAVAGANCSPGVVAAVVPASPASPQSGGHFKAGDVEKTGAGRIGLGVEDGKRDLVRPRGQQRAAPLERSAATRGVLIDHRNRLVVQRDLR